jgi:hypothetical protein
MKILGSILLSPIAMAMIACGSSPKDKTVAETSETSTTYEETLPAYSAETNSNSDVMTQPMMTDWDWNSSATTDADVTRDVQSALNSELDLNLQVDGIVGPQTRAALEQFQAQRGLEVTGTLDAETLSELDIDRAPASVEEE